MGKNKINEHEKDINLQLNNVDFYLRSEMAQEIISSKPAFIETSGIYFFIVIVLSFIFLSWFVKYPDTITTRGILTVTNAPKEIFIRHEGRVTKLLFQNNDLVKKGQIIALLESTANHQEVLELSDRIDSCIKQMNEQEYQKASKFFKSEFHNLGEIQQTYQNFITPLQKFNDYKVNSYYQNRRKSIENDIQTTIKTSKTLLFEKKLLENDLNLAEESFNMNKKLWDQKVISKEEFRTEASKYNSKQMSLPQLESLILNNTAQENSKRKEMDQLDHDMEQDLILFVQSLKSLKSAVEEWKQKYIILSPIDGVIIFLIPLHENQFLSQGKLIGYINPGDSDFYVETILPQENFGKIDTGLNVQLRFDAYPYQEAGFVEGELNYVSNVALDSGFIAHIKLKNGLITNNNKTIHFKNGLQVQAVIITKNMRLLQRIYYSIVKSTTLGNK